MQYDLIGSASSPFAIFSSPRGEFFRSLSIDMTHSAPCKSFHRPFLSAADHSAAISGEKNFVAFPARVFFPFEKTPSCLRDFLARKNGGEKRAA